MGVTVLVSEWWPPVIYGQAIISEKCGFCMKVSLHEKYHTNTITKAQNHALGHNRNEKSQSHHLP